MADSPVLYVYYRPDNDDSYPGVPNRHITEADWASFTIAQRRTIENATTQEGYTRRKVWVHRDLVDETEQERAEREAREQAAREAYERGQSIVRWRDFEPLVPGPGEVIVGSADGPVAVPYGGSSTSGIDPERTISVVGDVHVGYTARAGNPQRLAEAASDLATLKHLHAHRIYVGDVVDTPGSGASGTTPGANDATFLQWAADLDGDRADWDTAVGNHDIIGRTADQWAAIYGYSDQNWTRDLGFCRIVSIGADNITDYPNQHQTLSAATLDWLDAQLRADTRDTIILSHGPLANTTRDGWSSFNPTYHTHPNDELLAILDRYDHARAWICGHTHTPLDAIDVFKRHWTGSRYIAHINAGSIAYTNTGVSSENDPVQSLFVTMLKDRIEVRVRDHRARTWASIDYTTTQELPKVAAVSDGANPTAFVFGLDDSLEGETRTGPVELSTSGSPGWTTQNGQRGLLLNANAHRVFLDPRPYLSPSQGSIVVRVAFAEPVTSTQYALYHKGPGQDRLHLQRANNAGSPGVHQKISASVGDRSATGNQSPTPPGVITTIGLNWSAGRAELYVDGTFVGVGTYASLAQLADVMYFGSGASNGSQIGGGLFGVAGFTRPLTPVEHQRFAWTRAPWSMHTVTTDVPNLPPLVNPTSFVLPLNGSLDGTTQDGTVTAQTNQEPSWATVEGQQGIQILNGAGQRLWIDPTELLSPTQGAIVVRGAFATIEGSTSSQYIIGHKTAPGDRIYVTRGANPGAPSTYHTIGITLGNGAVAGVTSPVVEDDEIVTVGLDWDGAIARLFLNGTLVGGGAYSGFTAFDTVLAFGSSNTGTVPLNHTVFAAAGFTRALTAAEHARLASAGDTWTLDTVME